MISRFFAGFFLVVIILTAGCADPFYIRVQDPNNPASFVNATIPGKPKPVPLVCRKGLLVKKDQSGEMFCRVTACKQESGQPEACTTSLETPDYAHNVGGQGIGGTIPGQVFPYGSNVTCPQIPVGNGLARC
jgi:hypothetical protein